MADLLFNFPLVFAALATLPLMPNVAGCQCTASGAGYFLASATLDAFRHFGRPSCPAWELRTGRHKNCTPATRSGAGIPRYSPEEQRQTPDAAHSVNGDALEVPYRRACQRSEERRGGKE